MIKAIIIEDESLIARQLHNKIKAVADDVQILEILPSLKTARRWLLNNAEPDVMFMDIQLGDGLSFELFDEFQLKCPVIFTTAYDEYAIRAFKVNGIDYLLKPVDTDELKKAIQKARVLLDTSDSSPNLMPDLKQTLQNPDKKSPIYKEKFVVNVKRNWVPIMVTKTSRFSYATMSFISTRLAVKNTALTMPLWTKSKNCSIQETTTARIVKASCTLIRFNASSLWRIKN
jgi:DNA-binding LytR/AlgR family response regulator